jgi:hypothetical protein
VRTAESVMQRFLQSFPIGSEDELAGKTASAVIIDVAKALALTPRIGMETGGRMETSHQDAVQKGICWRLDHLSKQLMRSVQTFDLSVEGRSDYTILLTAAFWTISSIADIYHKVNSVGALDHSAYLLQPAKGRLVRMSREWRDLLGVGLSDRSTTPTSARDTLAPLVTWKPCAVHGRFTGDMPFDLVGNTDVFVMLR